MSDYKHVLMGDTDSVYVRLDRYAERNDIEPTAESIATVADKLQKMMEADLPSILADKFVTSEEHLHILQAGREIVGRRGLFKDKKKRYATHIVDNEGERVDKMKVVGMETQRSDTPKYVQKFLMECLEAVVRRDAGYDEINEMVVKFRNEFRSMEPWRRGSPGGVRNLVVCRDNYAHWKFQLESGVVKPKKPVISLAVRAAMYTNDLIEYYNEKRWDVIRDGDKVESIYLRTDDKMNAVAIRVGETYVPQWFKDLPFDTQRMEEKLVDMKIHNVLGDVLGWDFKPPATYADEMVSVMNDFYE